MITKGLGANVGNLEGSFEFKHLGINHIVDGNTPTDNLGEPPFVAASGYFEGITKAIPPTEDIRTSYSDDAVLKGEGHIQDKNSHNTSKKRHMCTKSREHKRNLIFGEGIGMEKLEETSQTILVGCVRGRNYTTVRLKIWTTKIWGKFLEQLLGVLTMNRGWFALFFPHPKTVNWLLTKYYI